MNRIQTAPFRAGLVDALPIFFGYLAVGFAFGLCAVQFGHPAWSPILMSITHISGTGQFAVINQLHDGGGTWEVVLAVLALNLRYILMALSVAQRLAPGTGLGRRLLIAMGDTDEIVGVAVRQRVIGFRYYMGLTVCSAVGWVLGTVVGVSPAIGAHLPAPLVKCLGLALYAMFLAIIVPGARDSKAMRLCVVLAAVLGIGLRLATSLGAGWVTLIAGLSSAVVAALLFPKEPETETTAEGKGGAA